MPPMIVLGPEAGKGKVHVSQIYQAARCLGDCPVGQRKNRTVIQTIRFESAAIVLQFQYQVGTGGGEVIYVERARFANKPRKR